MTNEPGLPLDPLTLPLRGSRLIEASAGTGKTWTIAALYLRLVLGHGEHGTREPRALGPSQILVMTFTRAATRELAGRIRERLIEAARAFRDPAVLAASADGFLRALAESCADAAAREQAAHRLALAAEAMDEAAVHTIDAWCQRMLREHAFDSGNLFSEELVADETELLHQAMLDVWRREVYPLPAEALDDLLAQWPTVEAMRQQVGELLRHDFEHEDDDNADGAAADDLPGWLPRWTAERRERLARLKAGWAERADTMVGWIEALQSGPKPPFSGVKMKPDSLDRWRDQIRAWAGDPAADRLVLEPPSGLKLLRPSGLVDALKKGCHVGEIPPEFAAFERLLAALQPDALPPLRPRLMRHVARRVAERLDQLKRRQAQFGFADLQRRLVTALDGPAGPRLRAGILAQYPVALIDEFQDTSPLQFRLFDLLYRVADDDPATALLMIGDPKQSIYGFRGADIHGYLRVRRATAGRHHVLGTNFRSTEALVTAVNAVFAQAERHPQGAFRFGAAVLPFEAVQAQGRAEVLEGAGEPLPALQVGVLPEVASAEGVRGALAAHAAARIVGWLDDPAVGFRPPGGGWQRLVPGDIAVLVRSRTEADAIRSALRRRGVASVYLSDQDSVFASAEAADLLRWLQAVAVPHDTRLARAAWATAMVGLPLAALARLVQDEVAWDERLELLRMLRGVWQRQGVLTLVRQTLHRLDLPARWLAGTAAEPAPIEGERRLTNLLHLGELLQAASARLDGEQAQLRWLAEQIAAVGQPGEERVVRLESDAELVQVVTVHKSKGLEYPVVVLPFAASARPVTRQRRTFVERIDAGTGRRTPDFTLSAEAIAAADLERLREELRLFYVALTRPRHLLWLGVGLVRQSRARRTASNLLHHSALGYLLGAGQPLGPDGAFEAMRGWSPRVEVRWLDRTPSEQRLGRRTPVQPLAEASPYVADFERDWTVGSFSALVRDAREAVAMPAALLADPRREAQVREEWSVIEAPAVGMDDGPDRLDGPDRPDVPDVPNALEVPDVASWHDFPRGALAGNFLHELLQMLAEEGLARHAEPGVQAMAQRRCERGGHGERVPVVLAWMAAVLTTPLPPLGGAALVDVATRLPEMEFWMPSRSLRSAALDAACRVHLMPGEPRPALVPRQLDGMLMGFADLVFAQGGRWWVLDYKSNRLGDDDAAYHAEALQRAVLDHRYELQAALYLLALHRLLRQRLGDGYDPVQHLGGAVCLFLRGVRGPQAGCLTLGATPALMAALDACLEGQEGEDGDGDEDEDEH